MATKPNLRPPATDWQHSNSVSAAKRSKQSTVIATDMPDSFDIHNHRHEMKQLKDTGKTGLYDNRKGVRCPVCNDPFDRLFLTKQRETTFPENDGASFCLLNQGDTVYMFRH